MLNKYAEIHFNTSINPPLLTVLCNTANFTTLMSNITVWCYLPCVFIYFTLMIATHNLKHKNDHMFITRPDSDWSVEAAHVISVQQIMNHAIKENNKIISNTIFSVNSITRPLYKKISVIIPKRE